MSGKATGSRSSQSRPPGSRRSSSGAKPTTDAKASLATADAMAAQREPADVADATVPGGRLPQVTAPATLPLSPRPSARKRILAAANELFYEEGIHSVGIDRVIERAGVAKASLYNTFGSKDELVRAYLEGRQASREDRIMRG